MAALLYLTVRRQNGPGLVITILHYQHAIVYISNPEIATEQHGGVCDYYSAC